MALADTTMLLPVTKVALLFGALRLIVGGIGGLTVILRDAEVACVPVVVITLAVSV